MNSEKIIVCRAIVLIPMKVDRADDPKVIFCQHPPSKKHDPNLWGFPGGKPEQDEPLHVAATREARGETRIIAHPHDYLFPTQIIKPDGTKIETHYYLYKAHYSMLGEDDHDDKPQAIRCFSLEEIRNFGLPLTASAAEAIENLEKFDLKKWAEILYP